MAAKPGMPAPIRTRFSAASNTPVADSAADARSTALGRQWHQTRCSEKRKPRLKSRGLLRIVTGTEDGGADPHHGAAMGDGGSDPRSCPSRGIDTRYCCASSVNRACCVPSAAASTASSRVFGDRHQAAQHQAFTPGHQGGQAENLLLRRTGFAALSANIDLQTDI